VRDTTLLRARRLQNPHHLAIAALPREPQRRDALPVGDGQVRAGLDQCLQRVGVVAAAVWPAAISRSISAASPFAAALAEVEPLLGVAATST